MGEEAEHLCPAQKPNPQTELTTHFGGLHVISDGSSLLLSTETLTGIVQEALNDCLFSHKLQLEVTDISWSDEDCMFHVTLRSTPAPVSGK